MDYFHSISKMTLGTVQLGLNYGIANKEGKPDEEKAFRILEASFSHGINCLDTASGYGDSEAIIGKFLENNKILRSDVCLVTKFKLGKINESDAETAVRRTVEESLKNLRTDYLDILLLHDANEFSVFGEKITETFEKLLSEGIVKMAGASCYRFEEIEKMVENEMYSAFQIPVNLLDTRITNGIGAQKLKNKLVFARSIFLQGLFFLDPANLTGNLKETDHYLKRINEIAGEMNMTIAQLSVNYVNSLQYINSLVVGADNPEQVIENRHLFETKPFSGSVVKSIEDRLMGVPDWVFMPATWDKQNN